MIQKPYIVERDSGGKPLVPIGESHGVFDESWLQNTIEKYPDILPVNEIEQVFSPLISIGKEVKTDTGGFIDNLFISPGGYITLVETKLWRNSEAKREVLAQVIDYATSVSQWTYRKLDQVVRQYTRQKFGHEVELVDWVKDHHKIDPIDFGKNVSKNLERGRFLALIVGDRIRENIINYLEQTIQAKTVKYDIGFVELRCFTMNENDEWPLFVVPFIPAQTRVVEHHYQAGENQQTPPYSNKPTRSSITRSHRSTSNKLTESEYWNRLKSKNEKAYFLTKDLIDFIKTNCNNINIWLATTSIVVSFSPLNMTVFYIYDDGYLETTPKFISRTLRNKGYIDEVFGNYETIVRDELRMIGNIKCKSPIVDMDIEVFKREVVALLTRIQSYKRRNT